MSPPKRIGVIHHITTAYLGPADMLRIAGPQMALEWVRGRSHCHSGWRKSKSLAKARNLFAGPQGVLHGRLRAFAPGL